MNAARGSRDPRINVPPARTVASGWCHEANASECCRAEGAKASKSTGPTEPVLPAGWVSFPLAEHLAPGPGSLTPAQEEHLVHWAPGMPLERAAQMLHAITGVQVREATGRRHPEKRGQTCEDRQNAQRQEASAEPTRTSSPPKQGVMSADGADVPFVGGVWAEVRTLAIGEVKWEGEQTHTTTLSSFSRMTAAVTFGELVEGEMPRRQVREAEQVAAVMDGAPWLPERGELDRVDAGRIRDFPHAAQRINSILEAVQQAGHALPLEALSRCLHGLKHRGPAPVLRWLRHLTRSLLDVGKTRDDLASLHKRAAELPSPRYQDAGWPIGSGMVESANKLVMPARLKGAGMHWAPSHVNPLLAFRNSVCNDRWDEDWQHPSAVALTQRKHAHLAIAQERQQQATQRFVLAWAPFLLPRSSSAGSVPPPSLPPEPPRMVAGRPTAQHPWRRPWASRPSTAGSAKM